MQACFECWVSWRSVASSLFELEDKLACFLKGSISQFFSHITGRVQVASCTPFNLCFSIFALFFIKKIQNKQRSSRRKRVLLSPLSIIWCIWFLLLTVTKNPQFKMTHCFNIGPIQWHNIMSRLTPLQKSCPSSEEWWEIIIFSVLWSFRRKPSFSLTIKALWEY